MHLNFARKFAACFIAVFVWLPSGLQGFLFKPLLARAHRQITQGFGFGSESPRTCFCNIALQNNGLGTQGLHKQDCYGPLFDA